MAYSRPIKRGNCCRQIAMASRLALATAASSFVGRIEATSAKDSSSSRRSEIARRNRSDFLRPRISISDSIETRNNTNSADGDGNSAGMATSPTGEKVSYVSPSRNGKEIHMLNGCSPTRFEPPSTMARAQRKFQDRGKHRNPSMGGCTLGRSAPGRDPLRCRESPLSRGKARHVPARPAFAKSPQTVGATPPLLIDTPAKPGRSEISRQDGVLDRFSDQFQSASAVRLHQLFPPFGEQQ